MATLFVAVSLEEQLNEELDVVELVTRDWPMYVAD